MSPLNPVRRRAARQHQATLEALPILAAALHPMAVPTIYLPSRRREPVDPLVQHVADLAEAIAAMRLQRGDEQSPS